MREGVGPGRRDAEVTPLTGVRVLSVEPGAARYRVIVVHAQEAEALVESAVGVDLRDDLLSDVAALVEAEGALEPGLLGVDGLVDVFARLRHASLCAQAV